jgi:hypothetical protein
LPPNRRQDVADTIGGLLETTGLQGWQIGATRVFLRAGQLAVLEVCALSRHPTCKKCAKKCRQLPKTVLQNVYYLSGTHLNRASSGSQQLVGRTKQLVTCPVSCPTCRSRAVTWHDSSLIIILLGLRYFSHVWLMYKTIYIPVACTLSSHAGGRMGSRP